MWAISANRVTLPITTWRFAKASEEVVIRTFSLRNCDLNDLVGISLVWNFFRSEEFLSQIFWSKSQHWWLVSCLWSWRWNWCLSACQVVSELQVWRRVVSWKWIVFSWPFTLSTRLVFFYESGGPWMSVNCSHLTRSPNSTIEFVDVNSSFAVIEVINSFPV